MRETLHGERSFSCPWHTYHERDMNISTCTCCIVTSVRGPRASMQCTAGLSACVSVYTCLYTYTTALAHVQGYAHTYIYTGIHQHIYTDIHVDTLIYIRLQTCARMHITAHACLPWLSCVYTSLQAVSRVPTACLCTRVYGTACLCPRVYKYCMQLPACTCTAGMHAYPPTLLPNVATLLQGLLHHDNVKHAMPFG